jgi:hypothetical protein
VEQQCQIAEVDSGKRMHVCYLLCGAIMSVFHSLRNTFRAVLLGGLVLSHQGEAADTQKCTAPQPAVDSTYSSGQVWSYKAPPQRGFILQWHWGEAR